MKPNPGADGSGRRRARRGGAGAGQLAARDAAGPQVPSMSPGLLAHAASFLADERWRSRHQMRRLVRAVIATGMRRPGAAGELQQLTGAGALVTVSRGGPVWTFDAHVVVSERRLIGISLSVEMRALRVVAVTVSEGLDSRHQFEPVRYSYAEAGATVRVSWEFELDRVCKIVAERTGHARSLWRASSSVHYQPGESFEPDAELVFAIAGTDGSPPLADPLGEHRFRLGQATEVFGQVIVGPLPRVFEQLAAELPDTVLGAGSRDTPNARLPRVR